MLAGFAASCGLFSLLYGNKPITTTPSTPTGVVLAAQTQIETPKVNPQPLTSTPSMSNDQSQPRTVQFKPAANSSCQVTPYSQTPYLDLNLVEAGFSSQIDKPVYYKPAAGNNLTEIYNNVANCAKSQTGLNGYQGATSYTMKWSYGVQESQQTGLCRLANLKVAIRVSQILPYYEPGTLPSELEPHWQQIVSQLASHENEHSEIDRNNASRLYGVLSNLSGNCDSVAKQAEAYINQTKHLIDTANNTLDSITSHGRR